MHVAQICSNGCRTGIMHFATYVMYIKAIIMISVSDFEDKHISVIGLYRNAVTLPWKYAFVIVTVRLQVIQYPSAKDTPF